MTDGDRLDRYSRQTRFVPLGVEGQRRLLNSRVAVCGSGALGTVIASGLVRAGVGFVRIIDRDIVELSNLQRQILFDESDAREGAAKAEAAARRLREANSSVTVEPAVVDIDCQNVERLLGDVDLVFDGTDNFETRFLINDFCQRERKPWIYGGAVGSTGQTMTVIPGETPCLRCLIEEVPPPGTMPTCETAGILASATMMVASVEVVEGLKLLSGRRSAVADGLLVIDLWSGRIRRISLDGLREKSNCPACSGREYPWLNGGAGSQTSSLCGRQAVQVMPARSVSFDWDRLCEQLSREFTVKVTPFLARFSADGYELTVFRDGRTIVRGTDDVGIARSMVARYIGS